MATQTFHDQRARLTTYFDETAAARWAALTSDEPVSGIRATVRAGRDAMRQTLLSWLPKDLAGRRILDAGCGTGALAEQLAQRGAHVVAVDVAGSLLELARQRVQPGAGRVDFVAGDMLSADHGRFDHVVAMDSLVHYRSSDIVEVLSQWAARTQASILFTVAPKTALLTLMHVSGRLIPRGEHRAPAIQPVALRALRRDISAVDALACWELDRCERISSGFYTSQACELRPT